jgi:hypothetical protein
VRTTTCSSLLVHIAFAPNSNKNFILKKLVVGYNLSGSLCKDWHKGFLLVCQSWTCPVIKCLPRWLFLKTFKGKILIDESPRDNKWDKPRQTKTLSRNTLGKVIHVRIKVF